MRRAIGGTSLWRGKPDSPRTTFAMEPVTWVRAATRAEKSFQCPCCKFKTLYGRGQDEICKVCFWHDDGQDEADTDRALGGPNRLSLRDAQKNFQLFGAIEERFRPYVRAPLPDEREIDVGDIRPVAVAFTTDELVVTLADGRKIATPLSWYPRLLNASASARQHFELMATGIRWPELDEDLGIAGMLRGRPVGSAQPR
jgi:Cysteine-rich CPCC/Protein of unknown function (DUF2442)